MILSNKECFNMHSTSSWIIINGIVNTFKNGALSGEVESKDEYDIKLTIDGKELNFLKTVECWQTQIDRMIREEAEKLIKEKFNDKIYQIESKLEQVNQCIKETFNLTEE